MKHFYQNVSRVKIADCQILEISWDYSYLILQLINFGLAKKEKLE